VRPLPSFWRQPQSNAKLSHQAVGREGAADRAKTAEADDRFLCSKR
jgi:hypothetical protein